MRNLFIINSDVLLERFSADCCRAVSINGGVFISVFGSFDKPVQTNFDKTEVARQELSRRRPIVIMPNNNMPRHESMMVKTDRKIAARV
jgi:hypothetical protein